MGPWRKELVQIKNKDLYEVKNSAAGETSQRCHNNICTPLQVCSHEQRAMEANKENLMCHSDVARMFLLRRKKLL